MEPGAESCRELDPAIVQRAAEWMARLWSGDPCEEDMAACARWRADHPDHELAWSRLQALEGRLYSVQRDVARHVLGQAAPAADRSRRRSLQWLGLLAGVGTTAYAVRGTDAWSIATAGEHTGTGEIRAIVLSDGSRVVLASASAIDLRFDERDRLLLLRAGEIFVATAPDPAPNHRPFRVRGRHGTVTALGTRFSLRQDDDRSHVAVFEGAVEIRPKGDPGVSVRVGTGQRSTFSADRAGLPAPVPHGADAWTRGLLVADGMRLDAFLAELGRYRPGLLRCDPAVAHLKVNGVFSLRDTDRALENLTLGLPVSVLSRTRYWVTVRAAH